MSEGGTTVLEKKRVPGEGLRMMLSQRVNFPKPIPVYNPRTGFMEEKTSLEVLSDASIPEHQYSVYEGFSPGRDAKDRIILLLAALGYGYPTTAISEATGLAHSTTCSRLWELKRDGLLEGGWGHGGYTNEELWPYKYGVLREAYWMLTPLGATKAGDLMRLRVVPLAPPREEVLKEMKEHPWFTMQQAERVARERMEETARKVQAIREKRARGEELSPEELKVTYGERVVSEEIRRKREQAEISYIEGRAPVLKVYDEAGAQAEKAYKEAVAQAREVYRKATAQAWMAYGEDRAPTWKVYEEATAPARKAFVEAVAQARKAYEETVAQAEMPWDAAGRRAEEARKKYDERKS